MCVIYHSPFLQKENSPTNNKTLDIIERCTVQRNERVPIAPIIKYKEGYAVMGVWGDYCHVKTFEGGLGIKERREGISSK
jgi:hypothetical protein